MDHECTEIAGEMAFDFSLSIFPAAVFTAALAGLLGITPEFVSRSLDVMGIFLHDLVREMVEENVRNLVAASSPKLMTIGLLGALWAASSAISATIKALNRAYGVEEARSFWFRRMLSVGLMVGVGLAMVVSFNFLIMGTWIEQQLLVRLGLVEGVLPSLVVLLKWPVGFLSAVVMAGLLYHIAPNYRPKLLQVLPGAVLFAVLWFFLSKGFGYYVGNFSYYNRVYGLLGGFIALQIWIYLTALFLLVGGELNAELAQGKRGEA
jgi:membrane protein